MRRFFVILSCLLISCYGQEAQVKIVNSGRPLLGVSLDDPKRLTINAVDPKGAGIETEADSWEWARYRYHFCRSSLAYQPCFFIKLPLN